MARRHNVIRQLKPKKMAHRQNRRQNRELTPAIKAKGTTMINGMMGNLAGDYVDHALGSGFFVQGDCEESTTGMTLEGTKCAGYEQYFETLNPGAEWATLQHAKKTRTILVVAGSGVAAKWDITDDEGELTFCQEISRGSIVEFEPGVSYCLAADEGQLLQFFVIQEKSYTARMVTTGEPIPGVEYTPVTLAVDTALLAVEFAEEVLGEALIDTKPIASGSLERRPPRRPRGMSKAATQNSKFRGNTAAGQHTVALLGRLAAAHSNPNSAGTPAADTGTTHALGVNPQPMKHSD